MNATALVIEVPLGPSCPITRRTRPFSLARDDAVDYVVGAPARTAEAIERKVDETGESNRIITQAMRVKQEELQAMLVDERALRAQARCRPLPSLGAGRTISLGHTTKPRGRAQGVITANPETASDYSTLS